MNFILYNSASLFSFSFDTVPHNARKSDQTILLKFYYVVQNTYIDGMMIFKYLDRLM